LAEVVYDLFVARNGSTVVAGTIRCHYEEHEWKGKFVMAYNIFKLVATERTIIGQCYRGYTISPIGSVIGLGWGLVGGAVFAWLYNVIANRTSAQEQI
jgi:hypothetical protein